jgi:hypothetical protein
MDEETLLILGGSGFQVTLKEPHMHYEQLIHLGYVSMLVNKCRYMKLLIWNISWAWYLFYIAIESPKQVMMR